MIADPEGPSYAQIRIMCRLSAGSTAKFSLWIELTTILCASTAHKN